MPMLARFNVLRKLLTVSSIATVALLTSCNHVKISDHEFCADFGPDGAHCANFLTTGTRDLTKAEWDFEREDKMICENTEAFADWKATLEKLCSTSKKCDFPEAAQMRAFFEYIEAIKRLQDVQKLKDSQ